MTEGQAEPVHHPAKLMVFVRRKHFQAIISDIFIFIKNRQTVFTAHTVSVGRTLVPTCPCNGTASCCSVSAKTQESTFFFSRQHNFMCLKLDKRINQQLLKSTN